MPSSTKKAEIYIGVVIAIAIFLVLSQAIVTLVFSAYDLVTFTQSRTTARYIAEEKIETVRNINFDDLGTVGGIPAGTLEPITTVVQNGLNYTIETRIDNIDDEYDGTGAGDTSPIDYKRIKITVNWGGTGSVSRANSISLVTDVSDQNDSDTDGGTLDITVSDASGNPVSLALVTIQAPSLIPPVNTTLTTDSDGKLVLPGSIACSGCYQISVTKSGFSTDRTYGTSDVTNPTNPHVSVIDNQISQVNLSIDQLGSLTIQSTSDRASGFTPIGGQQFILRGEKIIGTDSTGTLIYKYAQVVATNGSGTLSINNLEWDAYHILIPTGVGWDITGTNPLLPVVVSPAENQTLEFSVTAGSTHRLLTVFRDGSLNPIASVAAVLRENSGTNEASVSSGLVEDPDFGQSFFGNLANRSYTLYATASGFLEYVNTDVIVSDNTKQEVILINE